MPGESSCPTLAIRRLPKSDRPRERLFQFGAERLTTVELLAILVGSGGTGHSALDTGRAIMAETGGSLRRLRSRTPAELTHIAGVGPARATILHAALELARRWLEEGCEERLRVRSPIDIVLRFAPRMRDLRVEEFHVIVLDTQHGLQRDVTVTRGLLSSSPVHTREVFQAAIVEDAAAIVLLHNHPSGDPTPSPEDHVLTQRLATAGRLLDIPVYDHVIVGRDRYTSFLEEQWL
jgi:DNA repair protein RadC